MFPRFHALQSAAYEPEDANAKDDAYDLSLNRAHWIQRRDVSVMLRWRRANADDEG
jgi:hypothetical protein